MTNANWKRRFGRQNESLPEFLAQRFIYLAFGISISGSGHVTNAHSKLSANPSHLNNRTARTI